MLCKCLSSSIYDIVTYPHLELPTYTRVGQTKSLAVYRLKTLISKHRQSQTDVQGCFSLTDTIHITPKNFLSMQERINIYVLCYTAHTTCIYQGLDVVVFRSIKYYWTQKRDNYEQTTRQKIDKTNFISVYSKTHQKALTPETIHASFIKTGVWPFNPNIVTKDMMAPSLVISSVGHLLYL